MESGPVRWGAAASAAAVAGLLVCLGFSSDSHARSGYDRIVSAVVGIEQYRWSSAYKTLCAINGGSSGWGGKDESCDGSVPRTPIGLIPL